MLGAHLAAALATRADAAASTVNALMAGGDPVLAHGGLQPGNALVDTTGRVWLLDPDDPDDSAIRQ